MSHRLTSFPSGLRYKCTSCEEIHSGLPDLSYASPIYWTDTVDQETSFLTTDLCVLDSRDFFLRCLLEIPIKETNERLSRGVWSSVSAENFKLYADDDAPDGEVPGPFFGWFSNTLPGYAETLNLKCALQLQNQGLRPLIELEPSNHQLSIDQREGITIERALELIELTGVRILSV